MKTGSLECNLVIEKSAMVELQRKRFMQSQKARTSASHKLLKIELDLQKV